MGRKSNEQKRLEKQLDRQNEWTKKNCKNVALRFNVSKSEEQQAYEYLSSKSNKSEYIKNLILEDMKKNGIN